MKIEKKERDRIKGFLPKGWRKKIAEKCNCAEITVSLVMNGKLENILIAEAIISLAEEGKHALDLENAKKTELSERISSLKKAV